MAEDPMRENPLLAKLIAQGAESAITLRGYVGPSTREGYVRLYPRLGDLSESIEIARDDILHSLEEPRSAFGSVVVWVKKDAKLATHQVGTPGIAGTAGVQANAVEVRQGRLRMRMPRRAARDTCVSICSCGVCTCLCLVLPPWPPPE
jgi:hypothetical protein